jgi:hypothetical protein
MLQSTERASFDARFNTLWGIDASSILPQRDRASHDITNVKAGGVIKIGGEVFVVTSTATYTETNDKYTKDKGYVSTELVLYSLKSGKTHYLDWDVDDEISVSFTELKLSSSDMNHRLRDDEGQPFDINKDVDEACERKWPVMFDRKNYDFDDWWAFRFDSSDGRSEVGYMYEFGSKQTGWLTIEGWKDGKKWEYEGYFSRDLPPASIEVLSVGSN